jgi:calcium-dependent protein kinase
MEELRDALSDEIETNSEEVINAIMHDVDTDKVSESIFTLKIIFLLFFVVMLIK